MCFFAAFFDSHLTLFQTFRVVFLLLLGCLLFLGIFGGMGGGGCVYVCALTCARACVQVYACMCVCACVYVCVYMICVHVCICVCACNYVRAYVDVCGACVGGCTRARARAAPLNLALISLRISPVLQQQAHVVCFRSIQKQSFVNTLQATASSFRHSSMFLHLVISIILFAWFRRPALGPIVLSFAGVFRQGIGFLGHSCYWHHSGDVLQCFQFSCEAQWKGEENKADRGRGGKTTSGNGQAWSSVSPRGQWRTGGNGGKWLRNHLWCPNNPRG